MRDLKPCGSCGKTVSVYAKTCPHCGANLKSSRLFWLLVIGLLGGLAYLGVQRPFPSLNGGNAADKPADSGNRMQPKSSETQSNLVPNLKQPELKKTPPSDQSAETKDISLVELNTNPETFDGQTVRVRGELSGTTADGKGRYRLTFRSGGTVVDGGKVNKPGINFLIPKTKKDELMAGMTPSQFYQATLTVSVRREPTKAWVATVLSIDRDNR